jgi:hypothetical protein
MPVFRESKKGRIFRLSNRPDSMYICYKNTKDGLKSVTGSTSKEKAIAAYRKLKQ